RVSNAVSSISAICNAAPLASAWNPRDQMTQAMKWEGSAASTDNVGAASYEYCWIVNPFSIPPDSPRWIVNPFSIPLAHESLRATGGKDSSISCDEKGFTSQDSTGSDLGALVSGLRYEYDGLNLLRVDEIYGASLSEGSIDSFKP
ncbi:MAG: hypothetical protein KC994_14835, partial [Candidatus Omnitrophica bacterium]|nr:hypothetical protein [Candidatus Omnitrophota bacterium]